VIRATLDTTTLASGAVATGGTIGALIDAWFVDGAFGVARSQPILDELERTLRKRSFTDRLSPEDRADYQARVRAAATVVRIDTPVPSVVTGRGDNLVLATAESAGATYVVTGDAELRRLGAYRGIAILSARQFIELLEPERGEAP
jgi:putative PIN family toxin of toxin-antitoxin system